MARPPRSKHWMITCFELEDFAVPDTHPNFQYMVYQVEQAPTTERWHIQGYLILRRPSQMNIVANMFPCAVHLEGAHGTPLQCQAYCMKLETRVAAPIEFGIFPAQTQGQRTDLVAAATTIREHKCWSDVINDPNLFHIVARHGKWVETIFQNRDLVIPDVSIVLRNWQKTVVALLDAPPVKRRIIWIWSHQSGTGKTTFFDYCSSKYRILPGGDWTNTIYLFDAHAVVWFDRTRVESSSEKSVDSFYSDLERWSNHSFQNSTKYVPCRKLVVCHVVVTANSPPDRPRLPDRFLEIIAKHELEDMEEDNPMDEVIETTDMDTDVNSQ